ncbi:MAG: phosphatase PAP2 family protein [Acidimicrobiales bacterium]
MDAAVYAWCDRHLRARWAQVVSAALSNASDYGMVWVLVSAWRARKPGPARCQAVVDLAVAGAASYGTNRFVKRVAARPRPRVSDEPRVPGVRRPASSSFPSGHTLAAFTASVVLARSPAQTFGWLAFSSAVGISRVHLRLHHASDVLGGAVIGVAMGFSARPLAQRVGHRVAECACEPRR